MAERHVHTLYRGLRNGFISRRQFTKSAAALGVSATAIGHFLKAASVAKAQDALAPPVVAEPCEGDGCLFSGQSLTVQMLDDSVRIPWDEVRDEFEAATGATLTLVADPIDQAFPNLLNDAATGSNQFDVAMIGMWWLGELVAGDYVVAWDDFYADDSGKFPEFDFEDELPGMQALRMYDGKKYVVPYDCDGQVLYYRRDVFENEDFRVQFEDEVGRELTVPQTWAELVEIAGFFTGKDIDEDGQPDHGISMHLKVGGQGMFHFMSLSAPYVIGPENPKLYWFDPENMDPIIESEGHRRAMEAYLELVQYGPQAQLGWALGEAWDYFLRGKACFTYSWGDVAALAVENDSYVKGRVGTAQLPGTYAYVNPLTGEEFATEEPNLVGNTTGGSWAGVIMRAAEQKGVAELAYYFLALTATEEKQRFYAARGTDGVDPGRLSQMPAPIGTGSLDDYTAQGWDEQDAEEYVLAYYDNFGNSNQLPYLRIPATFEYWSRMDIRLSEAVLGEQAPEQALAAMADDFRRITEDYGVEEQLEVYKGTLDL